MSKEEQNEGRVLFLEASGEVVASIATPLAKAYGDAMTARLVPQNAKTTAGGVSVYPRPFDFDLLVLAMAVNSYHDHCCQLKAKDICGAPWHVAPVNEDDQRGPDQAYRDIMAFLSRPHPEKSLGEVLTEMRRDYEGTGNGYLEVVRDSRRRPAGLEWLPSKTMWKKTDGTGWVHVVEQQVAHYRRFGDEGADKSLNEVVWLCNSTPWSDHYGMPDFFPAWSAVAVMQLVDEFNTHFFTRKGIPEYAVMLEGPWKPGSEEDIRTYFRSEIQGKFHRTMVTRLPGGQKITFEKLTADTKDASFQKLWVQKRDEILQRHDVPPMRAGVVETGSLGGNVGGPQSKQYYSTVVAPGKEQVERRLTRVIQEGFQTDRWRFAFERVDQTDRKEQAEVIGLKLERDAITINEARAEFGLDPHPDGDVFLSQLRAGTQSLLTAAEELTASLTKVLRETKEAA